MHIKELNNIANDLSNKLNKSKISLMADMLKCKSKYKTTFEEYEFYEFYNLNDEERKTYLTIEKNNELIDDYDNKEDRIILEDRGLFYKIFKDYINRDYIDLRDTSFKDFISFIKDKEEVICKSINDSKCELLKIEKDKLKNEYNILKIYNNLVKKEEYIVETKVIENRMFSKIYSGSLKKVKIMTMLNENDVHIINKLLVIGIDELSTSVRDGALYSFLDEDGKTTVIEDLKGNIYRAHPVTYEYLLGLTIPYFKDIIILTKYLAKKIPNLKYVTWEYVINDNNITLMDAWMPYEILQPRWSIDKKKDGILLKIDRCLEREKV